MDQPADAAEAWRELLHGRPAWWSDNPVLLAASEHPALRTLFCLPTHGTLRFFRSAWRYPDAPADDLPMIVLAGPPYKVYTASYGQLVGEAATAHEVVELLVASLPG
jgi:hypothetical protein